MNRKATPLESIIAMSMVVFFVVFLAVKQFFVLKQQVYNDAYYGINQ